MEYGQVPAAEIFARVQPKVNIEQVVADIIENGADIKTALDRAVAQAGQVLEFE